MPLHLLSPAVPAIACPRQLAALLLALASTCAQAQSSISYSVGTGAGDYRSQALGGGIAPASWPVQLDADLLQARESGAKVMDQYGLSVAWPLASAWSLRYRWSNQKDTVFTVDGHDIGVTLRADKLWAGELETRVDLGMALFDYSGRNATAAQSRLLPDQRRHSLGLRQDINKTLGVYATYDQYQYSRDPVALARLLANSRRPRAGAAYALASFASHGRTAGMTWAATDTLDIDISWGRTHTVLRQQQDVARIAATLSATRNASVTLAYSDNRNSAVQKPAGGTFIAADRSSALDLSLAWVFD